MSAIAPRYSPDTRAQMTRATRQPVRSLAVPTLAVATVMAVSLGAHLAHYGGNLSGFIQFGHQYAPIIHPPRGAFVGSRTGYDGQFFYAQARDPLLLHDATVQQLRAAGAAFRMQRMLYPLLAFIAARGRAGNLPLALLAINVLTLLGATAVGAAYVRRRGLSTLWALSLGLMPGLVLATLRDLSDPVATVSVLSGLVLWRGGRRWTAALALSVAVLTREAMVLAIVAIATDAVIRGWRVRDQPSAWRTVAARACPVVVIPSGLFIAWQAYIVSRYGGPVGAPDAGLPVLNLIREATASIRTGPPPYAIWDVAYLLVVAAACVTAARALRAHCTAMSLAAGALALGMLIPSFGDVYSDTRLSAPLLALLLVDGVDRRHRPTLAICALAAAMTIAMPVAVPGSFW